MLADNDRDHRLRVFVGAVLEAEESGATAVHAVLRCVGSGAGRRITTTHDGSSSDRASDVDRVLAANGSVERSAEPGAVQFEAWLP